jgi:hypothetical protein
MAYSSKNGLRQIMRLFSRECLNENDGPDSVEYEPDQLLDLLNAKMRIETDLLALHKIYMIQLVLRLILKENLSMKPAMLLALLNETTGISIHELRDLLGSVKRAPDGHKRMSGELD